MGFGNQCQRGRGLRPAAVGALVFAILTLTAFHPARALTPPAPADAHATLSPAEAERALAVLQDPGKRNQLIDTLRADRQGFVGPRNPGRASRGRPGHGR